MTGKTESFTITGQKIRFTRGVYFMTLPAVTLPKRLMPESLISLTLNLLMTALA
jgi:hypothetical protein